MKRQWTYGPALLPWLDHFHLSLACFSFKEMYTLLGLSVTPIETAGMSRFLAFLHQRNHLFLIRKVLLDDGNGIIIPHGNIFHNLFLKQRFD